MKPRHTLILVALSSLLGLASCSDNTSSTIAKYAIIEGGFQCPGELSAFQYPYSKGVLDVKVCSNTELTTTQVESSVNETFTPGTTVSNPVHCVDDAGCPKGTVCESCNGSKSCVFGCRTADDCSSGEICDAVVCDSCPCPAACAPAGDKPCQADGDCPKGKVCESNGVAMICVAGCHTTSQCEANQICDQPDCDGLPCPGSCSCVATCASDSDCPHGTVCEKLPLGTDCGKECGTACVPGCRTNGDCGNGQVCSSVVCDTCPCPSQCSPN